MADDSNFAITKQLSWHKYCKNPYIMIQTEQDCYHMKT